jgi:DNA-binding winged helix-turn-helix (wHTH) protein
MVFTCALTVLSDIFSSVAIALFDLPAATRLSTSSSRAVSESSLACSAMSDAISRGSDLQTSNGAALAFGPYTLLPLQRVVLRDSTPLQLGSRAREILVVLVERAGEVVDKRELLSRVWPDTVVEEATLRVHITLLRRALREGEAGARYVENITGRGYRFVAPVMLLEKAPSAQVARQQSAHSVREATRQRGSLLAFVHVDTTSLDGMRRLVELKELPEVEEIHSVTGESAMLLKVRTRDSQELDSVLERMYSIEGFVARRSYIALSTYLAWIIHEARDLSRGAGIGRVFPGA